MNAGVRELRDHLSRYLATVRAGHEVIVTDHGKAIARLIPFDQPKPIDRMIAEGLVTPAANAKTTLASPRVKSRGTVSDLVADQRR